MNSLNSYNFTTSPLSQPTSKLRRLENPTLRSIRLSEIYNRRNLNKKIKGKSEVKELDAETGLYYYGARYLDPRTSRWLSGDPAIYEGDYLPSAPINDEARKRNQNLPGMGGIFNYVNMHVYHYGGNNPVKLIDPDGRWGEYVHLYLTRVWGIESGVRPEYAEIIAIANNSVDSLLSGTHPASRHQSMHFNTRNNPATFPRESSSGTPGDSRWQLYEEAFSIAVRYINNGRIEQGLEIFGRGLHALQDMYAHTDMFVGYQLGRWSHVSPGFGNPAVPRVGPLADDTMYMRGRLRRTEAETLRAFERLKNAIDEEKRNIIFTE